MKGTNIMAYNTPELLLVGAAQNLVMGSVLKTPQDVNCEFDNPTLYAEIGFDDGNSW
jgi:hypothetical protein